MTLRELGEFGLIKRIEPRFRVEHPDVLGIGDDCAVTEERDGVCTLVTTDLLIEDVHFLRSRIPPRLLGRKALAVNISDIAAMGGRPTWSVLSVGFPPELEVEWLDAFFEGIRQVGEETGCALLGGDTTRSPRAIVVNLAVLGEVPRAHLKLRSSARVGDVVFVTGLLGDSGTGLQLLLRDKPAEGADEQVVLEAHHNPRPHVEEGQWLGAHPEVHALMDVSDGIDSDLRHIMERSGVGGITVDLEALPTSSAARRVCAAHGWDLTELAVTAGEDYCLAGTADPDRFQELASRFQARFGRPLWAIGHVTSGGGLQYVRHGVPVAFKAHGFDHFRQGG